MRQTRKNDIALCILILIGILIWNSNVKNGDPREATVIYSVLIASPLFSIVEDKDRFRRTFIIIYLIIMISIFVWFYWFGT